MFCRASLIVAAGVVALLSGCCSESASVMLNPFGDIPGYQRAFPVPRNDYPPGTVIVVWDKPVKGDINVICRGEDYMPPNGPTFGNSNAPINVSIEKREALKAQMDAKVKGAVETAVKGARNVTVTSHYSLIPVTLKEDTAAAMAASNSSVCRKNAQWYRQAYKQSLKRVEIVHDAAQVTFTYDISVETESSIDAGTQKSLSDAIGGAITVSASGSTSQHIHIDGAKVYTNYTPMKTQLLTLEGM